MNKSIQISFFFLLLLFQSTFSFAQINNGLPLQRNCGTLSPDTSWENWFSGKVKKLKNDRLAGRGQTTNYTIPVIVHILHSGTAAGVNENISLAQVQSQIDILNQDYSATNADISGVPSEFQSVIANSGIQFCLAKQDPNGVALQEYGVERINWQTRGWLNPNSYTAVNDRYALRLYFSDTVKPQTIWDPTKYLNVWLAVIDNSGLLGFSNYPVGTGFSDINSSLETATTSGVVINQKAWGNIGTAAAGKYNKGRTATHEIGHWLGVYHTFQDGCLGNSAATCSSSGDYCCDTPPEASNNFGCPVTTNTCTETPVDKNDMTMNFMEYVDDACMFMFTADQVTRMQTAMANGTYRAPLKNSVACVELSPDLSIISTQVTPTSVTAGNSVTVNFIEKNNAVGNANPNYVNFYLSSDNILTPGANGDTLLTQYYVNQMLFASSQTSLLSKQVTIPVSLNTGTYYLFLVADGTGIITETNETNNNASVPVSVDFSCQPGVSPTITTSSSALPVCISTSSQITTLSYSAVTNSPVNYSISWNATPANSFAAVTNALLPASPINITVPANTAAGIYTGTITVKNANGCYSAGTNFTVTVGALPSITVSATAAKCFSANAQTTTLPFTATGSPVTYSIVWNSSPSNNLVTITDSAISASPLTINIPANTAAGTYTGTISVKTAAGCVSAGSAFTLKINPLPTISVAAGTTGLCTSTSAQITTLSYDAVTDLPTTYSIAWGTVPANNFVAVNNAALPASPINITVPANTAAGTYTGTITVKNANGCISNGTDFSVVVTSSQATTITAASTADSVCFNTNAQASSLSYSDVTGSPVTYNMTWNTSPANSFAAVTNAALPSSPIGISVPAGTTAGTYTGTIKVKNAIGCLSSGNSFTLTVNPLPAMTVSTVAARCFSANAQTTTLAYTAVSGTPATYSIAWNSSPENSFASVTDSVFHASPITINIPAGTPPGSYTGTITLRTAAGCVNTGSAFTVKINPLPTISVAATTSGLCSSTLAQTTTLSYDAVTDAPTFYSIVWSSSPTNNFAAVTNATLPASPINITVPANTTAGTYTGTITVKNANGCISNGTNFTVVVTSSQATTITAASTADSVCFNANAQASSLSYSDVTGSPVTYNMTWNTSPANSFAAVTNAALPSSPIGISVPAGTAAGTYTGTLKVKNAIGCLSSGNSFTLTVNPLPTITLSTVAARCFSANAQTTTLAYTAVTGTPAAYSIAWNSSPENSFAAVTDSVFHASPITINIPAGTPPGSYTGTITLRSAKGCVGNGYNFTVKINALPTITTAASAAGACSGSTAQTTTLSYSAVTDAPTNYSITWSSTPTNNFATVTNAALPASPVNITVPANTAAGTYTGTITVKNANGCVSGSGNSFNVLVTNNQTTTITSASVTDSICFSSGAQTTSLAYSDVSGYPVKYSLTWNASPVNGFIPVTDSALPVSPIGIAVPAGTVAGTYTGTIKVKNAWGCSSSGNNFTVTVRSLPTITSSAATSTNKCFNTNAQTTTLTYSAVTGSPTSYSITWNPLPANNFAAITNATLASSPITINIPGGTLAGTYTGTIKVKNAVGCISEGNNFTVTINPLPSIAAATSASPVCFKAGSQITVLPYSSATNSPTTYSIVWNANPANSFTLVSNAALPANAINITVPAATVPATYSGTVFVKSAAGCVGSGKNFSLQVNSNPSLGADTAEVIICSDDVVNIANLYNTSGLAQLWNVIDSEKVSLGIYQLVGINTAGCKDTASITVRQDINKWLGSNSDSWHDPLNWSSGKVPNDSTHALIIGATTYPCTIITDDASVASLQIVNGGIYNVVGSKILTIKGSCKQGNIPQPQLPSVITASPTTITQTGIVSGGYIMYDGGSAIIARGICISRSPNPTIADTHTLDGSGSGSFISTITGLLSNTGYYIRSYATNSTGTSYGNQVVFGTSP